MPRITDERREARREQILEGARACLQEHGLEAVSMEMIISRSGLPTGAVYGYFKGKDAPSPRSARTSPPTWTGCWSPCTAGATPRAAHVSRRSPAPPTAATETSSPTRSGGGRRTARSTRARPLRGSAVAAFDNPGIRRPAGTGKRRRRPGARRRLGRARDTTLSAILPMTPSASAKHQPGGKPHRPAARDHGPYLRTTERYSSAVGADGSCPAMPQTDLVPRIQAIAYG